MAERSSLVRLLDDYDLELDWRGFELHPETPPGGLALADVFGAARSAAMRAYVRRFAEGFGITDFAPPERMANTRRALAVAEFARDRGRLDAFRTAAMDAYWSAGADLEDDAVLGDLAVRAGLGADEAVRAARDPAYLTRVDALRGEAHGLGVTGIPTFFIGDEVVVGCQPYPALAAAAERAGARRRPARG